MEHRKRDRAACQFLEAGSEADERFAPLGEPPFERSPLLPGQRDPCPGGRDPGFRLLDARGECGGFLRGLLGRLTGLARIGLEPARAQARRSCLLPRPGKRGAGIVGIGVSAPNLRTCPGSESDRAEQQQ